MYMEYVHVTCAVEKIEREISRGLDGISQEVCILYSMDDWLYCTVCCVCAVLCCAVCVLVRAHLVEVIEEEYMRESGLNDFTSFNKFLHNHHTHT